MGGGESNGSVMVLHHTPKIYELIHEGSVSTVTLNQLISMRWCQSPSSIWLELIDQANILLVQCLAFNECYLLHWWQGGRNKNHLLLSFPQMLQMEESLSTGRLSRQKNKNILFVWAVTDSSLGIDFGAGGSFLVSTLSVCDNVHSVLTH